MKYELAGTGCIDFCHRVKDIWQCMPAVRLNQLCCWGVVRNDGKNIKIATVS